MRLRTRTSTKKKPCQYLKKVEKGPKGRFVAPFFVEAAKRRAYFESTRSNGVTDLIAKKIGEKTEVIGVVRLWATKTGREGIRRRDPHTYSPHHPVVRENKNTSKLSPVNNVSFKSRKGVILNEMLDSEQKLLPETTDVFLRFRMAPKVLLTDIKQTFLQRDCRTKTQML